MKRNKYSMNPNFRTLCRLFVLTVLILLTARYNSIYGQNRERVCSRISIVSIVPEFSQLDKGFDRDVLDYFERAQLRNRLVARAQAYLNRQENRTSDRIVESTVLVVDGLLHFGLTPDDSCLTDQIAALRAIQKSESVANTPAAALISRTLNRYRLALTESRTQGRAAASYAPTAPWRRASAVAGTGEVSPVELRLLASWESDNARLADVPTRLRPTVPQPLNPEYLIAAVAGVASSGPGGSSGVPDSTVCSRISPFSAVFANVLRPTRPQGFVLFAQTVVLRV